jgi:tRNA U55 pseudouridine synthase TruB
LRSGEFHAEQAVTVTQLDEIVTKGEFEQVLISPAQALEGYPEIQVSDFVARRIRQGLILDSKHVPDCGRQWPEGPYKVVDANSNLVAIVARAGEPSNGEREEEVTFKTLRVFGTVTEGKPRLNPAGRPISL